MFLFVQVLKSANAPRLPDCFQKTPKKVTLTESGQILAVAVDCEGETSLSVYYTALKSETILYCRRFLWFIDMFIIICVRKHSYSTEKRFVSTPYEMAIRKQTDYYDHIIMSVVL